MQKSISPAAAVVVILIVVIIIVAVGYFGFIKKGKKAGTDTQPAPDQKQMIMQQMSKQAQMGGGAAPTGQPTAPSSSGQ